MKADEKFMELTLKLAEKGSGFVSPNPMVGCVLVKNRKILAQAFHEKFSDSHAEINALQKIKFKAAGATLYVNLEPCHHFGKTPPCVDAVIASGVKRVVIAMSDPNPLTSGKSIRKLRAAGVKVTVGVCAAQAKILNKAFVKFITEKIPYVIVKVAQSLDGKISDRPGKKFWFTGESAMKHVQNLRSQVDAILVGRGTVAIDDPQLNVRDYQKPQPRRIVLDSFLKTNLRKKIFHTRGGEIIFFCALRPHHKRVKLFQQKGVRVLCLSAQKKMDLKTVLKKLQELNVASVLVEGGMRIFTGFLQSAKLVDEWQFIVSPSFVGQQGVPAFSHSKIKKIKLNHVVNIGPDTLLYCKISGS